VEYTEQVVHDQLRAALIPANLASADKKQKEEQLAQMVDSVIWGTAVDSPDVCLMAVYGPAPWLASSSSAATLGVEPQPVVAEDE
jgi:hypothetical protein